MATIPVERATSILGEVESVYDDITKRAYEKFLGRGGSGSIDIEDWFEAEMELKREIAAKAPKKVAA